MFPDIFISHKGWYSNKSVKLDLTGKAGRFKISPGYNYNFLRESSIVTIAKFKLPQMPDV